MTTNKPSEELPRGNSKDHHTNKWVHTFWASFIARLALSVLYVSISGLKIIETNVLLFTIRDTDTLRCFSYQNNPFFYVKSDVLPGDMNALIFKGKYALSEHNELKDVRGQLSFNSLQQLYNASLQFETPQNVDFKITLDGVHQTEIKIQAIQNEKILWENATNLQGPLLYLETAPKNSEDIFYQVLLSGGMNIGIQAISKLIREESDSNLSDELIEKSISISQKKDEKECPLTPLDTILPEAPTQIINSIKKLGYAP